MSLIMSRGLLSSVLFFLLVLSNNQAICAASACSPLNEYINMRFDPPTVSAGRDTGICSGSSISIGGQPTASGGTPPYTYMWSPAAGLNSTSIANPIANPNQTTKYIVTVIDGYGLSGIDTVLVRVDPKPNVAFSQSSPIRICPGTEAELTLTGKFEKYLWSTGDTSSSIRVKKAGTYNVTVWSNSGCSVKSNDMQLIVETAPNVAISGPDFVCDTNATYTYAIVPVQLGYTFQWQLKGGSFISGIGTNSATIKWPSTGSLSISAAVVNMSGCSSVIAMNVEYGTVHPTIRNTDTSALCESSPVVLTTDSTLHNIKWSTGDTTRSITVSHSGNYTVRGERGVGCLGVSDTFHLRLAPSPQKPSVSRSGNILTVDTAAKKYHSIQWYYKGKAISGATDATFVFDIAADTAGTLQVQVSADNGCSTMSDTLRVGTLLDVAYEPELLRVYPNPVFEQINLVSHNEIQMCLIQDELGRVCLQVPVQGNNATIDLRSLSAGVYNILISTQNAVLRRSFIKL